MNKFRLLILILIGNIFYITYIHVLNTKVETLTYENNQLNIMIDNVISYSNHTADTGEFDEFICSKEGESFFNTYENLHDK